MIGAPDVHVFVLRTADYEGVVMTERTQTRRTGQAFMEQWLQCKVNIQERSPRFTSENALKNSAAGIRE